jgi:hypothetical protein
MIFSWGRGIVADGKWQMANGKEKANRGFTRMNAHRTMEADVASKRRRRHVSRRQSWDPSAKRRPQDDMSQATSVFVRENP